MSAKRKRDAIIRVYSHILWVTMLLAVPLSAAREIWPDLWLTWMIAATAWSVVVAAMRALFFLLTKNEERNVWTIGG